MQQHPEEYLHLAINSGGSSQISFIFMQFLAQKLYQIKG